MSRWIAALVTAALILTVPACGSDDGGAEAPAATATAAPTTESAPTADSEPTTDPEPTADPDFPIEEAPDATRREVISAEQLQLEYTGDDFDRLVAFYDSWTQNDAATYERFEGDDGSIGWRNDRPRGDGFRAISVALFAVGGDVGNITVVVLLAA